MEEQGVTHEALKEGRGAGETPLYTACREGRTNIVRYLMERQGENHEALKGGYLAGETPLYAACRGGYLAIVRYLMEKKGVEHEALKEGRDAGKTPLSIACDGGNIGTVCYLLEDQNLELDSVILPPHDHDSRGGRGRCLKLLLGLGQENPELKAIIQKKLSENWGHLKELIQTHVPKVLGRVERDYQVSNPTLTLRGRFFSRKSRAHPDMPNDERQSRCIIS